MNERDKRLLRLSCETSRKGLIASQRVYNRKNAAAEKDATPHSTIVGDWSVWGSSLASYEATFLHLFKGGRMTNLLKERSLGGESYLLDLMADDVGVKEAVEECGYKGGLAVSLGFASSVPDQKNGPVGTVHGDLLEVQTWVDIRKWMKRKKINYFDTIIARPLKGSESITGDPVSHLSLLRKAWSLLSPDNGLLLFQAPYVTLENFRLYSAYLKAEFGIQTNMADAFSYRNFGRAVMMVKTPDSPAKLPLPKTVGIE